MTDYMRHKEKKPVLRTCRKTSDREKVAVRLSTVPDRPALYSPGRTSVNMSRTGGAQGHPREDKEGGVSTSSSSGFSLIEVLVASLVLLVGLIMISQFFASAAGRVLESDIRSVLHQVATQEIETIRAMPYSDVGTEDGHPQGVLEPEEDRSVDDLLVHIHREVVFWTDPSYEGPYPANYRRVTVTVSAPDHPKLAPVEMVTNVAGGAEGGTLDITVTNLRGEPVQDAALRITNDNLVPRVDIHSSAIKTDQNGRLVVPGLTPDLTPSYVVEASKPGYNSASTEGLVVEDGLPFTVVHLIIDLLADLRIKVEDTGGNPVEGLQLEVLGPEGFEESLVSASDWVVISGIRYSTDTDPYLVRLLAGQGYDPQDIEAVVEPGTTHDVVVVVPEGGPTTTTTTTEPPSTTTTSSTTTSSTTATTIYQNTLLVRVSALQWRWPWGWSERPLEGARVTLDTGASETTNSEGWVFFSDLEERVYGLTISKHFYRDYTDEVEVSGATELSVTLEPQWW